MMSNINLYNLSNKIRTTLLTTIDKEMLNYSKKNHLLINSQNQEQLMKKFEYYRDFTIESEESFEGELKNEEDNMLNCNCSENKLTCFCYSPKTDNESFFPKSFMFKSPSPKKSSTKKIKNSEILENNLYKIEMESEKKIIPKMETLLSYKNAMDFKNSELLSYDNNKKHRKRFSADFRIFSIKDKNKDNLKLINYCYKLKIPNDETINEISDNDNSTNKESAKKILLPCKIKNKHKNISKKKQKKTINKKKSANKNSHSNDDEPLVLPKKKYTDFLSNETKPYYNFKEKLNSKQKNKISYTDKKLPNNETKKTDVFHWKNFFQLHHYSTKPPEKKSKGKKLEQTKKLLFIQTTNKKPAHKKSQKLDTFLKSIDDNPIILKHNNEQKENNENKEKKEKKNKKVKREKKNVSSSQLPQKHFKSSKSLYKKNDDFRKNGVFCFGKKISKIFVDERNESSKNERKNIIISTNCSIDKKQN